MIFRLGGQHYIYIASKLQKKYIIPVWSTLERNEYSNFDQP